MEAIAGVADGLMAVKSLVRLGPNVAQQDWLVGSVRGDERVTAGAALNGVSGKGLVVAGLLLGAGAAVAVVGVGGS